MPKVLIITYYWPPAGGPGVQRWLKFVTYLKGFGVEPIVYIPENPHYPLKDKSLVAEIPEGITILKKRIIEPYAWAQIFSKEKTETISSGIIDKPEKQNWLQKLLLYVRGNFFIPDARKFWVNPSVEFLRKYIYDNPVDAIITTGPPHSLHLIGLNLKAKTGLPWIADFRDPWTDIGYHDKLKLTRSSQKKHLVLERKVLNTADHIITTSPKTKTDFKKISPQPITCITNGFEERPETSIDLDKSFTLSHIGSLLAARDPVLLWEILNELKKEKPSFGKDLKIKLAGKVSATVIESIKEYNLDENVELLGYVNHTKALNLQRKAQVLLLIEINAPETRAIIPGKVFEYLAARRPILGIGPQKADFFDIVEGSQSGFCFDYGQKMLLKTQLLEWYNAYGKDGIRANSSDISKYTRENLTGKLVGVIDEVLDDER